MKLLQVVDYVSASAHRHGPGGGPPSGGMPGGGKEMPGGQGSGGGTEPSGQEGYETYGTILFFHIFFIVSLVLR